MLRKTFFAAALLGGAGLAGYAFTQDNGSPIYSQIIMPAITSIDPETAHRFSVKTASLGLTPVDTEPDYPSLSVDLWGRQFCNPIGLAAGFDKNAETMQSMLAMGFGFVEVGSICPRPQPGNPLPRVFRLKKEGAIINRYGFNSEGMVIAEERLRAFRDLQRRVGTTDGQDIWNKIKEFVPGYMDRKRAREAALKKAIVGVNLGKNKDSIMPSIEEGQQGVLDDYGIVARRLGAYADYLVVNVSSPNTPNLRDLQGAKELTAILSRLRKVRDEIPNRPPLLIKIAPDISHEQAEDIARVALEMKVDGIIISNTTVSRPAMVLHDEESRAFAGQTGGLSGRPLKDMSTRLLADMYRLTSGQIPLIGVGGVATGKDAYDKIRAGASLVQLYSALALEGPGVVPQIKRELAALVRADNYTNVQQAVGSAHKVLAGNGRL